ncbi:MAG: DUF2156 domain-containing protein [Desulfobacteraceae bacterium]|nr:DUF2156 domain-containing protein [Desulfobacteraceae bacterium]
MQTAIAPFRPIQLKDREFITGFTHRFNPMSCEYSFTNLFCWRNLYRLSWTLHQDRLLIHDGVEGYTLMPLGPKPSPSELARLSRTLINTGMPGDLALVPRDYAEDHPELHDHYTLTEDRDFADYLYHTDSLAELKGKKLHKKRNLVSQFHRQFPDARVEPMTGRVRTLCLDLAERLYQNNGTISKTTAEEHQALEEAFLHFEPLKLEGISILVEGAVAAFAVFSPLNSSTHDIHFEKSDHRFKGVSQAINRETAKHLAGQCTLVNREQDMGIPGLRKAKLSYAPARLHTTLTLKFRKK